MLQRLLEPLPLQSKLRLRCPVRCLLGTGDRYLPEECVHQRVPTPLQHQLRLCWPVRVLLVVRVHWLRWRSARCWELYAREGYLLRQGPSLDMMPRHLVPCRLCGAREGGYLPLGEYLPLVGKPRLSNPQEGGTKLRLASHPLYSNRCCSEQGRAPGSAPLTWLATLVVIPIGVAPSKVGLQSQRH